MADTIQLRRDTAANWVSANPVLAHGEVGVETDTKNFKVGDGTTAWNALNYYIDSVNTKFQPTALLDANNVQQAIFILQNQVFPLMVEVGSYQSSYEVGSQVEPNIPITIKRGDIDASQNADVSVSPTGTYDRNTGCVTDASYTPPVSGSKRYTIAVTESGQTVEVNADFYSRFYLYAGDIGTSTLNNATDVKNKIESSWRNSNKTLSNATTKGSTPLAASHYYLFAVKGDVELVVRDAATDGIITGCKTGKNLSITRVNGSGDDDYSWVIVPASPNSWNFKITNS